MSAKLPRPALLSPADFHTVVRLAPLVSVDLIIRNPQGEILLGLRANEPAKGFYFVPGGIVLKHERLRDAFTRILKRETNCDGSLEDARHLGALSISMRPTVLATPRSARIMSCSAMRSRSTMRRC